MNYERKRDFYNKLEQYGFSGTVMIAVIIITLLTGLGISISLAIIMYKSFGIASPHNIGLSTTTAVGAFIGGVIGPLISLASVFLLFLNLRMQRLTLQNQKVAQQQQDMFYKRQQFETTFYKLLDSQQDLLNNIRVQFTNMSHFDPIESCNGTEVFEALEVRLENIYLFVTTANVDKTLDAIRYNSQDVELRNMTHEFMDEIRAAKTESEITLVAYNILFNAYHQQLSHYFRHLYHLLKFIHHQEKEEVKEVENFPVRLYINGELAGLSSTHKKYLYYADLVQAKMSPSELLLLFYNGLKFSKTSKKLLRHYDFLQNLPKENLLSPGHEQFYGECEIDGVSFKTIKLKSRLENY